MSRRLWTLAATLLVSQAAEAATLLSARAVVEILADGACDVNMQFAVTSEMAATATHRLLLTDTTLVEDVTVSGARAELAQRLGVTLVVPVSMAAGETRYGARYLVRQTSGEGRCALLVPDAPTAGLARVVQLEVGLPPQVRQLPGGFPALGWRDNRGTVTLGHLPAFVIVPHAAPGRDVSWRESLDIRRVMDVTAILVLLAASGIWMASRTRTR